MLAFNKCLSSFSSVCSLRQPLVSNITISNWRAHYSYKGTLCMRWFPNFKLFANAKILDVNKSNQWKQLLQKRPPVLSKRTKSWKCTLNLDLEHTSLHFQHKTVSAVLLQVVNGFVLIRLSCMGIDEMSGNYKCDTVTYNHTNSLQDNSDDGLYTVDSFMLILKDCGKG